MWELWRAHDVFEAGTVLDANGIPVAGARALPDGEITAGTPTPALVPLPTLAMAPMPTATVSGLSVLQFRPSPATVRRTRRSTRSMTAVCRVTSSPAATFTTASETRLDFSKELVTAVAQSIRRNRNALLKSRR